MTDEILELAHTIVSTLDGKKGENILLLDLVDVCSFTDYFVLCTGSSERMLAALAEETRLRIKERYSKFPINVEGDAASGWVLVDYGDVILHLFSPDRRDYYRLEELWREGQVIVHLQ
jgi:ribosome-associated protein